jgi:hypothetical protein
MVGVVELGILRKWVAMVCAIRRAMPVEVGNRGRVAGV